MIKIDVVLGLQFGDEAKGKISHHMLKAMIDGKPHYDYCVRFNGGCNAGHTIYHDDKRFITHHLPSGVFHGIMSVIGPGCVLNVNQFFKEIKELEAAGIDARNFVKIANNVHIITAAHRAEDGKDIKIGTTKSGNGPAYRDKYNRTGIRAQEIKELKPYLIDMYDEFYKKHPSHKQVNILAEGAQGFFLDVDHGDYPYVTSSHVGIGGLVNNGFSAQSIRNVHGVIKCYETYVGSKSFQPKDDMMLQEIGKTGAEIGSTTGRPRQCNYLRISRLRKAIQMNGATHLIINKMDVLRELKAWILYDDKEQMLVWEKEEEFKRYIKLCLRDLDLKEIKFSDNPYEI